MANINKIKVGVDIYDIEDKVVRQSVDRHSADAAVHITRGEKENLSTKTYVDNAIATATGNIETILATLVTV